MIRTLPIMLFIIVLILASCQKIYGPTIKIIKPSSEQAFNSGETIEIAAELSDPDAMGSEALIVSNANGNDTIINFIDYSFHTTYYLDKSFVGQPSTRYKIVIIANAEGIVKTDSLCKFPLASIESPGSGSPLS